MIIYPYLKGGWDYLHAVWHTWQTLNVGVLAFLSSLVAFNISKYNAENQRERELVAATSFLPQALSDMCSHFTACAQILSKAWDRPRRSGIVIPVTTTVEAFPEINDSVKSVFSECIRHGSPVIGTHLAEILKKLQISDSRISGLHEKMTSTTNHVSRAEVQTLLFYLAELQSLVNATFPFARSEEEFNAPSLDLDEFVTGYLNLSLRSDIVDGMREYTKQRLERKSA